jgi:diguanylate cyclase (GGDEF)-like protein
VAVELLPLSLNPPAEAAASKAGLSDPALLSSTHPRHAAAGAFTNGGQVRVLVADDDPSARRRLVNTLVSWGYAPVEVPSGVAALAALTRPKAPRLGIVDWEMPGLNGIEVCRLIRGLPNAPYTYLLLMTAHTGQRRLVEAMNAGADDYVHKPFDEQELEVRLRAGRRIVQLQEQLLEAQVVLKERAIIDPLTAVKNRGALVDALAREATRCTRSNAMLCVVMLDVDHFKAVNDRHGHSTGDAVLRAVAKTAGPLVRGYDTFGRYGGEEFMVIAPECNVDQGVALAERLRVAISRQVVHSANGPVRVTVSLGVAAATCAGTSVESIVEAADRALYRAKAAGRNCVKFGSVEHAD